MTDAGDQIVVACPECGNRYKLPSTASGRRANCKCGVTFKIQAPVPTEVLPAEVLPAEVVPAMQETLPHPAPTSATPSPPAASAPGDCVNHPGVAAMFGCSQCRSLICRTCDVPQPGGSHVCSKCEAKGPSSRPFQPPARKSTAMPSQFPAPLPAGIPSPSSFGPTPPGPRPVGPVAPGVGLAPPGTAPLTGEQCEQHAETPAVVRCTACGKPVCETCVFRFPNGASLCPKCATDTTQPFSKKRKILAGWALGLAGAGTLMLIVVVTGMFMVLPGLAGGLLALACVGIGFLTVITGMILAFCSLSKREGNPPIVWSALVWNCLLLVIPLMAFVALMAMGIMGGI